MRVFLGHRIMRVLCLYCSKVLSRAKARAFNHLIPVRASAMAEKHPQREENNLHFVQ
ncbi:hypothetical protein C7212DRAFT_304269 [Tuber magnatum]|uniref:Uncharacterized protein n=1 Tax=Tuber magnatum TaxID=42249 RepID=A0A317T1M1_9PEZI|nr:hypothetical protein C7212DRAFT_304269 [Tuber magnatum]